MNQLATALRNALGQDAAEKIEAKSKAAAYFDFFPNNRRRTGINPRTQKAYEDSHLQGRMTQPVSRLKQIIAECEVHGWDNAQIYVDLWLQHDGTGPGPMITGQARNLIPADKRFVPQPQAPAADTGTPPAIDSPAPPVADDSVTP